MVAIDEIDIKIIQILDKLEPEEEEISIYKITKKLFPEIKNDNLKRKKDAFITYRIRRLCKYGLIEIDKIEGITYYCLIANNAYIDHLRIGNKFQKSCYVCIDNKWYVYPLP